MKLPEVKHATGVTTIGLTGITILAGVIFANISPWSVSYTHLTLPTR